MMGTILWSGRLHSRWMPLLCRQATGERCEGIPRDLYWRVILSASTPSSSSELRGLALISSLSSRLQSVVQNMIFSSSIFLRILSFTALLEVVDCLFESHLLDAIVDVVAESVSVFSFKRRTQTCNKSCITFVKFNQVCIWMDVIAKLYNKSSKLKWKCYLDLAWIVL